jgi:hypothetical protein
MEYQLCVHPVVAGSGLPLFENINDRTILKLIKTKTFGGGAVTLYYKPTNQTQRSSNKLLTKAGLCGNTFTWLNFSCQFKVIAKKLHLSETRRCSHWAIRYITITTSTFRLL